MSQVNAKVSEQSLGSLRTDGFKTVYADVGEYLEVADQPDSRAQRTRLAQLKSDLKRFVARASNLGFTVHAVAGGPNWTDAAHRYLGPKLVQLVADYNGAVASNERLQGVQLDIEPYVDRASSTTWRPRCRTTCGRSRTSWTGTGRCGRRPATAACGSASRSPSGSTGLPRRQRSSSAPRTGPSRRRSISSTCSAISPTPMSW